MQTLGGGVTEREYAIRLAHEVLDKPFADPDGALATLARQFLRTNEALEQREAITMHDQREIGVDNPRADCLRACLASLTGVRYEWIIDVTDPALEPAWNQHMAIWARTFGWEVDTHDEPPSGYCIAVGPTERPSGNHAVIYHDGKLYFDPHPSRSGLLSVKYAITLNRSHPLPRGRGPKCEVGVGL